MFVSNVLVPFLLTDFATLLPIDVIFSLSMFCYEFRRSKIKLKYAINTLNSFVSAKVAFVHPLQALSHKIHMLNDATTENIYNFYFYCPDTLRGEIFFFKKNIYKLSSIISYIEENNNSVGNLFYVV